MTEKVPDNILERIRKCLSLGDTSKGATEAEAKAAVGMAKTLMAKYNLSMSDVEVKEEAAAGAKEAMDNSKRHRKEYWEKDLARVCRYLFSVQYYYTNKQRDDGRWVERIVFVGAGQDSSIAAEAYTILLQVVRNMSSKAGYGAGGAEANAYRMEVVDTLKRRAHEATEGLTVKEANRCTAIMVVKNQVVEAHMKSLDLRPARASSGHQQGSLEAYHHGKQDGKGVSLNFRNSLEGK